jgi:cytoskeletal protein CcmA (bactofilin family)
MLSRRLWISILYLLMPTLVWWSSAHAMLVRAGEEVYVAEDESISEDMSLFGSTVSVDGYVDSDVIAFSQEILVPGIVNQDLMGAAETVEITGQVGDDLRVGARFIDVRGPVGDDAIAFCQRFTLGENGLVGGEARVWCAEALFRGDVNGNVRIGCETAEIYGHVGGDLAVDACCIKLAGTVDGDVELKGESISLLPGCVIAGNLKYTSINEMQLQEGAQILGQVEWLKKTAGVEAEAAKERVLEVMGAIIVFFILAISVGQIIVGMILIGLSRNRAASMASSLAAHPWKSLGTGLLFLVCVPIACFILLFTIIGWPLLILATLFYLIMWYLGSIVTGLTIGGKIVGAFKENRIGRMLGGLIIGLIILRVITLVLAFVPVLGFLVWFIVFPSFGMGAILIAWKTARDQASGKIMV